jgi:hypothetical protein
MVYRYGRDHLPREEQAYRRRGPQAGVRTIEAHTKKAPSRPPSHIHQGAFMMGPSSGTGATHDSGGREEDHGPNEKGRRRPGAAGC